jgi:hypothetical protein
MKKRSIVRIASFLVVLFLFSGSGMVVTHAEAPPTPPTPPQGPTSQSFSLAIAGEVVNAGNQHYNIQAGGPAIHGRDQPVSASVLGTSLNLTKPLNFNYHLDTKVSGLTVTGNAAFQLMGTLVNGSNINLEGNAQIVGAIPAVCLPSFSMAAICASTDTSEVPAFFLGLANIHFTVITPTTPPGKTRGPPTPPTPPENVNLNGVQVMFESAYLNPFGNPIVIASSDFYTLSIVAPYTQATIDWSNVAVTGELGGTLGQKVVSGTFAEVSQQHEDLVAGTTHDSGTIAFSNVLDQNGNAVSALDVAGRYTGASTIPTVGSYDCSASIGFPANSGVCTETGFLSTGNFNLHGQGNSITGSYSTSWTVPAFAFSGTASGTAVYH